MSTKIKNIIPVIALFAFILAGCEGAFVTIIEVDSAEFPPRLCVSAILDTDSGRFNMSLYEGRSFASPRRNWRESKIIRKGTVNLFQDDELMWTFTDSIDLSSDKNDDYQHMGAYDDSHYNYIDVRELPVKAGSTYRLEVEVEGYEKVISSAAMPSDPIVDNVSMDFDHPTTITNIYPINNYHNYGQYYPVKCTLKDSDGQDYYVLQASRTVQSSNAYQAPQIIESGANLGITNLTLIQDNPDYESGEGVLDTSESGGTYLFSTLLFSDISFPGSSTHIDGFIGIEELWNTYPERPAEYDPETNGAEVIYENTISLVVKHITAETFKHYRSLVLQSGGMGFFSEPVSIISNVENGYGCFSLQNTRRFVLKKYNLYYYPDWNPTPPNNDIYY